MKPNPNVKRPGDPELDPHSLTEQEHKDSCDINLMLKNLALGNEVRGSQSQGEYAYDDTTQTALDVRIAMHNDLDRRAQEGVTKAELDQISHLERSKRKFKINKTKEELEFEEFKRNKSQASPKPNEPNEPKSEAPISSDPKKS